MFENLSWGQQTAIRKIITGANISRPYFLVSFSSFSIVFANFIPILINKSEGQLYVLVNFVVLLLIGLILAREQGNKEEKLDYINYILACKEPAKADKDGQQATSLV